MDPYLTLGVPRGCTREEVKEAFLARARSAHPDQGGEPLAFIELRAAYEQVMNDLGGREGAEANADGAAAGAVPSGSAEPKGPGTAPSGGGYASWVRVVADHSRQRRPDPKAVRLRRLGAAVVVVLLVANVVVFWSLWEFGLARSKGTDPALDPPGWTAKDLDDEGPEPFRPRAVTRSFRKWERRPADASDFFIMPDDGTLYLAPLPSGSSGAGLAAAETEFGLITDDGDVSSIFKGLPGRPIPNREISAGPVSAGSKLRLFLKKGDDWAFSDGLSAQTSFESFVDRDLSLGGGGSIVEEIGENAWVLHLDDIGSTDDDDGDILIRVRLVPN